MLKQSELNKVLVAKKVERENQEPSKLSYTRYIEQATIKPRHQEALADAQLEVDTEAKARADIHAINRVWVAAMIAEAVKPLHDRIEKLESQQHGHNAFGHEINVQPLHQPNRCNCKG